MVNKISVIGAGAVGSNLAFHLFSRLAPAQLAIVDIAPGLAKGVSLDIEDSRCFFDSPTKIEGTDDYCSIKDSDIVVVTAGVARKDGMSRLDLLKINAKVAGDISAHIKKHAKNSIVIVLTNPMDIITYIVHKATGFPKNRVIGMGSSLDSARLLNILHKESGLSTASLDAFVFGLHNNTMIVSENHIKIKGTPTEKFFNKEAIKKIQEKTALRGGEIIGHLKNRSASFAPSFSAFKLINAIAQDSNEIIPVSALLSGEYGLKDICVGLPCVINKTGISRIIEMELNKEEKEKITSAQEEFKQLKDLGI
ncbi:MAG: malate dehydrogenase [Candidatus Omnitrophota bacterium]